MPEFDAETDESIDGMSEVVDIALEVALEAARDDRVREHIREARQHRIAAEGDL